MFRTTPCSQCLWAAFLQGLIAAGLFFLAAIVVGITVLFQRLAELLAGCAATGGTLCVQLLTLLGVLLIFAAIVAVIVLVFVFLVQLFNCNRTCVRGK